jgi:hypothetical protein
VLLLCCCCVCAAVCFCCASAVLLLCFCCASAVLLLCFCCTVLLLRGRYNHGDKELIPHRLDLRGDPHREKRQYLSVDDFAYVVLWLATLTTPEMLRLVFSAFDSNADEVLEPQERRALLVMTHSAHMHHPHLTVPCTAGNDTQRTCTTLTAQSHAPKDIATVAPTPPTPSLFTNQVT